MKKGIAVILLSFYFVFSTGVVINLHYCMNRFDSSKLGSIKSEICTKCGMHTTDSNGCCHDELKVIKIQDDQKTANSAYSFDGFKLARIYNSSNLSNIVRVIHSEFTLTDHSPPLNKQFTYLQNCVFRI